VNGTPAHELDVYSAALWTWSVAFIPHLVTAILILVVGYILSKWASRSTSAVLERTGRVDITARPAIAATVRYTIMILVLVVALAQLGVQTASLLAVLGAAGLAVGLALQGTLTNIAAGIMLLWLRPFRVGDYIEVPANNISGAVREIGLFVCRLDNVEGISVVAPNSAIWNSALRNHTHNAARLVGIAVTLRPEADVGKARDTLATMLNGNPRILKAPPPLIFVENYNASAGVVLNCSFRASPTDLGDIQRTMVEDVKRHLDASAIGSLVPQQIVRALPADADPSRFLESTPVTG
jgi:small conductance mechanosensitive channel